jgi:hypothetical protein
MGNGPVVVGRLQMAVWAAVAKIGRQPLFRLPTVLYGGFPTASK